ncbi:MAG: GNAT family N-acetyltransferase [Acidobacteria bacterium]|nr:GNAT family N-acetyltransferase [Acidobacteriota bacterium]
MPDMLVNLLKLPPLEPLLAEIESVVVRRARVWEIGVVRAFVEEQFSAMWADEISVAYARRPVSLYVATREGRVVGFAAYECTSRAFFGPTGVAESERGRGIGRTLLVASLWGLRELGYVYGIIGGVGPFEFYERAVGATIIPGSAPGIYTDLLRTP